MRKIGAVLAAIVLVPVAVLALLLARSPVQATSTVDPEVTIRCDGSTAVSRDVCAEWGDQLLAGGAPSTTFEMQDLVRLDISRPMVGFAAECQVDYFLQRYPDDAVWTEKSECLGG